jgi:3-hydroxyisobutyrate dehydrogenase-like beta-hydroxyacid dehydrogenase
MPVTALVSELYRLHIAKGDGELDSISIFKLFDRA